MNALTKRLTWALALSLCVNLFIGGFIAARALHRGGMHPMLHGPFMGPHGMLRDARGPLADSVRAAMHRHGDAFHDQRTHLRDAQHGVHAALTAEPFDAQALAHSLGELRARTAESQHLMHDVLLEVASTLPADQRRELSRNAQAMGPGFGQPPGL